MPVLPSSPLNNVAFRDAFANAAVGIAMVDLEGRLLAANPALCQLSGYSAEELAAIGCGVVADGEGQDDFSRLVAGEIPGYVVERRYPHKDGSSVWFRNSISLLHDDHGRPTGAMAIMEDWTAKKHLEERTRQSQKMEALGSLAGGVAHDFNNLLMIINSYATLLKEEFGVDTPMGGKAHAIEEAGTRAAVLTRQLLAFSRKQVLQTMRLSIDELLLSSQQMLRRLIREDIEFVTHPGAGEACIEADPGQLQQVLMNLVVNASDAMPHGGRLTIQSSTIELAEEIANGNGKIKPGLYVQLSVADTGIGMGASTQAHIFEPFFTTKGQGKGTGLGLATVYGVVEQSAGHIMVESAPGKGCVFTIYLPAVPREPELASDESPVDGIPKPIRANILLVEDEDILRRCLHNTLSSMGCFVLQASDGAQALEMAKRQLLLIDLVVTDIVMPRMNGRELVNSLRALRPKLPVIFMSGYSDIAPTRDELRSGSVAFFQKPFGVDGLRKAVEDILAGARIPSAAR
jgi:two-component system, cell cycle sensor histidine kinase and response regulator CckA